ncbi:hypothetical protein ABEB36_001040 [Hypothenemus hampei]|uniref:Uncharacterized protein n=1 Tax=Hypothenemus hampei TaxID=57062 RepID=A0ABD1FF36_HYPHA
MSMMIRFIVCFVTIHQIAAQAVEVLTPFARSSQYYIRNHNVLAREPLASPTYLLPSSASISQFTRYVATPYAIAPSPLVPATPLAPAQPGVPGSPQPPFQALNPDAESVDIESGRLRNSPNVQTKQKLNSNSRVGLQQTVGASGLLGVQNFIQDQVVV